MATQSYRCGSFLTNIILTLMLTIVFQSSVAKAAEENPLTVTARFQPSQIAPGATAQAKIAIELAKDYHAYVDKFKLSIEAPDDFKLDQFKITPVIPFSDPFTHKTRDSVEGHSEMRATVEVPSGFVPGVNTVHFKLTYQACTTDHCLFPKTLTFTAPLEILKETALDRKAAASDEKPDAVAAGIDATLPQMRNDDHDEDSSSFVGSLSTTKFDFTKTLSQGFWSALVVVFLMGLLTCLTPCIYPMIPITLAILGTRTKDQSRWKGFSLSAFYVLGIAFTYSILGVAAAKTGAVFGSALSNIYVVTAIALIFVVMAISMYGFFEIQVPAFIRNRIGTAQTGSGYTGAFVAGLIAGVVASPCVGPVLVSILAHIASTQDSVRGFAYLFTFALGLGVPFLILGTSSSLLAKIPKAGGWMDATKFIFGTVMIAMALYYIYPLYPDWLFLGLAGLACVGVASAFGAFEANQPTLRGRLRKGAMLTTFCLGIALIIFGGGRKVGVFARNDGDSVTAAYKKLPWKDFSDERVKAAIGSHRPIVIDFSAEWCLACMELEHKTFTDDQVAALAEKFTLLKVDATEESPALDALRKRYGVIGLPTLIFYDPSGRIRDDLTLTGFEDAQAFHERLVKAMSSLN